MDRILNANAAKNRLARTVDVTVPLIDILVELKQPEKTMAEVERRYSKSDESGRYELILIASQIGTSQAEEFILRAERNEHGFLRSGALIQLKNFADEPSVAKVLQETMEHDPEDGMRWSAACGLSNIDPEAIGMLDQMAREKKAPIDFRRMSIDHIGASPIPKAKAILERLAKFGPEDIRGYAQNALLVRSDKGVSK
jgi:hypothetical protein